MPAANKVEEIIPTTQIKLLMEEKFYFHRSVNRVRLRTHMGMRQLIRHQENNGVDILKRSKGLRWKSLGDSKNNEGNILEKKTKKPNLQTNNINTNKIKSS